MKSISVFIFILYAGICFGQNANTVKPDSTKEIKPISDPHFSPIRFDGKLYGFITGAAIDTSTKHGYKNGMRFYKEGRMAVDIKLFAPITGDQKKHLEDSVQKSITSKNKDAFVSFEYNKDYNTAPPITKNDDLQNQASSSGNPDNYSARYYIRKSGKIRNGTLTFGILSSVASAGVFLFISPIAGELLAGVSAIIIIVEGYRANNMLIKAADKMALE